MIKKINLYKNYENLNIIKQSANNLYFTCYDNTSDSFCLCKLDKENNNIEIVEKNQESIECFVDIINNTLYYYYDKDEFHIVLKNLNNFFCNIQLEKSIYEGYNCYFLAYDNQIIYGQKESVRLLDTQTNQYYNIPKDLMFGENNFYKIYNNKIYVDKSNYVLNEIMENEDIENNEIIEYEINEFIDSIKNNKSLKGKYIFKGSYNKIGEFLGQFHNDIYLKILEKQQYYILKNNKILQSNSEQTYFGILNNNFYYFNNKDNIWVYNNFNQLIAQLKFAEDFEFENLINVINDKYIIMLGYNKDEEVYYIYNIADKKDKFIVKQNKLYEINHIVF